MRKPQAILEAAYDDPCGVTAAFNRNILARINRDLGGYFDLRSFQHRAIYDDAEGRIEMYLVSDRDQQVAVDALGLSVSFTEGEAMHTENSYKYSPAEIETLSKNSGLYLERCWFDADGRFSVNLFGLPMQ